MTTPTDPISPATPREHVRGERRETMAARMVEDYTAGLSVGEVGAKYGRSYGAAHRMLSEAGVAFRGRGGANRRSG